MTDKKTQALKLAQRAIEAHNRGYWRTASKLFDKAVPAISEALAEQPEQQKPVAWWIPKHTAPDMVSKVRWSDECEPLYTSPQPNKPWVGLTDEEKKEIERLSVYVEGAIRHTEAKLKEKNA